jgi:hypothetical protein
MGGQTESLVINSFNLTWWSRWNTASRLATVKSKLVLNVRHTNRPGIESISGLQDHSLSMWHANPACKCGSYRARRALHEICIYSQMGVKKCFPSCPSPPWPTASINFNEQTSRGLLLLEPPRIFSLTLFPSLSHPSCSMVIPTPRTQLSSPCYGLNLSKALPSSDSIYI